MDLKRSIRYVVLLLCCMVLISACGTLQVGLEPTPASTSDDAPLPSVTATYTPALPSPTATATERADATPTPRPLPTADVAPGWATYRSERFRVSFRYPPSWQFDAVHGGESYRGEDGYFILDAIGSGGAAIDAVAANQVSHHLLPFGTNPVIEELEVGGQEARLILPAADASMGDQALLIVRYPQPVTIQGTDYDDFALYADQAHIRTIAQTVQFAPGIGTGVPSSPWEGLVYQTQGALWRIDALGEPVQVFDDPQAVLSPDGTEVVTSSAADGDAWLFDLVAGTARRLTETPGRSECCYQWWPVRPELLLLSSLPIDAERGPGVIGHLTAVGLDGAAYQVLDAARDAGPGAIAPSPDGGTIAYGGGSTGWLYRWEQGVEAFDPAAYGLGSGKGLSVGSPSWSPDGARLAWIVGGGLGPGGGYAIAVVVFDPAAGTAQVLHPYQPIGRGGWPPAAAWNPDGEWLAVETWDQLAREPGVWLVRADGSQEHDLGRGNSPVWSPDGQRVAFARSAPEGGSAIWIAEIGLADQGASEPQRLDLPVAGPPVNWIAPSP